MKFHRSKESASQAPSGVPENLRFDKNLPSLTNIDLEELVKVLEIKNFRGIFMRDTLPPQGIKEREVGIINLNSSEGKGTHWVCYSKNNKKIYYFDSFGLDPPLELQEGDESDA